MLRRASGLRSPGRGVALVEVATRAKVAPSVVSRLLNGDATLRIRAETELRIRVAVRELDYHPNASARALRMSGSGAIGLLVYDVSNPLFVNEVAGATASANEAGYVVLLADAAVFARDHEAYKRLVYSSRLDGILFQGGGLAEDVALVELAITRVPMLLLNWQLGPEIPSVLLDDAAGVQIAVDHLVSLGHRDIGHITGFPGTDAAVRRKQAFEEAIASAGLTCNPEWTVAGAWDVASGKLAMRELLAVRDRPSAVFVDNVISAIGAIREAFERSVAVPHELSLVALHDSWVAEHTTPSITTVKLPFYQMGWDGVKLLLDARAGSVTGEHVVRDPAPVLMVRGSTSRPKTWISS
jgi:LacI family transcriptional regulator